MGTTPSPDLGHHVTGVSAFGAAFAVAGLVSISILYLAVFLVDRGRKAYLWFAIQGGGIGDVSAVRQRLRRYDGAVLATSMSTEIYTSVQFTHHALSLGPPSRLWLGLIGLTIVTALIGPGPVEVTSLSARVAVCTIIIGSSYQLWVIGRLAFGIRRLVETVRFEVAFERSTSAGISRCITLCASCGSTVDDECR